MGAQSAQVRFTADDEAVSGLQVAVTWEDWHIDMHGVDVDLLPLKEDFSSYFTSPLLVFSAIPDGFERVVPEAMAAVDLADDMGYLALVEQPWPERSTILGVFPGGISFGSLAELARRIPLLPEGALDGVELPGPVQGALEAVLLMDVSAEFDWGSREFFHVCGDLRLDTDGGWDVIPGFLALEEFSAWFYYNRTDEDEEPAEEESELAAGLAARLSVGSNKDLVLDAALTLPDLWVTATIAKPDSGSELFRPYLPEDLRQRADLQLEYAYIQFDAASGAYSLGCATALDWDFGLGLELSEVLLEISSAPDRETGGTLVAKINSGDTPIVVMARKSEAGWGFSGTARDIQFDGFCDWFYDTFRTHIPASIRDMQLSVVHVEFDSQSAGAFHCRGSLPLGDRSNDAEFVLHASVGPNGWRFDAELSIEVTLGDEPEPYPMVFAVSFGDSDDESFWTASWAAEREPLPVLDVLRALGLPGGDWQDRWPEALKPTVSAVSFSYRAGQIVVSVSTERLNLTVVSVPDPLSDDETVWAFQLAVRVTASLKQIPLVGGLIPWQTDLSVTGVRILTCSGLLDAEQLEAVNTALAEGVEEATPFPMIGEDGGLLEGPMLILDYTLPGVEPDPLILVMPTDTDTDEEDPDQRPAMIWPGSRFLLPAGSDDSGETDEHAALDSRAGSVAGGASCWVDVGAEFGPLLIQRIGLNYRRGVVYLMVEGSLSAMGMTLSVEGMGLGLDLNAKQIWPLPVKPRIDGVGLDFNQPPLHIGGAFLRLDPPPDYDLMLAGSALVELPQLGLFVVGAYQRRENGGSPSLFLFGRVIGLTLGLPPFVVTGFAAGFGYNSTVAIPGQSQVASFPLVAGLDEGGLPDNPMAVLQDLIARRTVSARPGQVWLAAGMDFSIVEFIRARVLLLLEIGDGLTVALLGTAAAAFPPEGTAYAQVKLQLRVVYSYAQGLLAASAELYDSFVIDRSCVLTGGFAFSSWFGNSAHPGEFVLTIGGYHPDYRDQKPDHYPVVPRLGFSWSLGSNISITGGAYFALTPREIMAGGVLAVRYKVANVKAWLDAKANLWITWAPVTFRAEIGVVIGASIDLWLTKPSGELSARLQLWGPPTGGRVEAKFVFVTVKINFGSSGIGGPKDITWPEFVKQLPEEPVQIAATEGLLVDAEEEAERIAGSESDTERWLVGFDGFTFRVSTAVPASTVTFEGRPISGDALDIRPMRKQQQQSPVTVTVQYNKAARGAAAQWGTLADPDTWPREAIRGNVPSALWGKPRSVDDRELVPHQLTGVTVTVPPPTEGDALPKITEQALGNEEMLDAVTPVSRHRPPAGVVVEPVEESGAGVALVAERIARPETVTARGNLHQLLDTLWAELPNDRLSGLAAHAAEIGLPSDPLLVEGALEPEPVPEPRPAMAWLFHVLGREVGVVDLETMEQLEPLPVPSGFDANAAVATPDGSRIYTCSNNGMWVIDTASRTIRSSEIVGTQPFVMAVRADGQRVLAASIPRNRAVVVDPGGAWGPRAFDFVHQGSRTVAIDPEQGRLFALRATPSTVDVYATETGQLLNSWPLARHYPYQAAVTSAGQLFVFVTSSSFSGQPGSVQALDPDTGRDYAPLDVGNVTRLFAGSWDGAPCVFAREGFLLRALRAETDGGGQPRTVQLGTFNLMTLVTAEQSPDGRIWAVDGAGPNWGIYSSFDTSSLINAGQADLLRFSPDGARAYGVRAGANRQLHVVDATAVPPRRLGSIDLGSENLWRFVVTVPITESGSILREQRESAPPSSSSNGPQRDAGTSPVEGEA
ncbi:DUF6603 domain-containing protein [Kitasatospora sp. NPDC057936]|uniref:DUF6603 domain-containing protein n=1 Tax=Kitasatospora sp. NPDC057936 TaxID=3346283 RepID=UPI0036DA1BEE